MSRSFNKHIYIFLIPAAVLTFIFMYLPMVGILMAFEDYNIFSGSGPMNAILVGPWVGFDNFRQIFADPYFWNVFMNTLQISFLKIVCNFWIPIGLAILLNEIIVLRLKKVIQTIIYLPHFLSWVIVSGIWLTMFGGAGLINSVLVNIGFIKEPFDFLLTGLPFQIILIISDAWKEMGWSAIIYLAAITSIDYQLYEAIKIDGGNKLNEIFSITIPGIFPTIVMMFILRLSSVMDAGFDQIFNMYNPYVYEWADVISTYVYRLGMTQMQYSQAATIGLFNSVIAFVLVVTANSLARRLTGRSIW
ncbi:MAG: ABC transporter permease [Erysipelotrichaceae bacterium]